jgi:hypothetical protein
MRVLATTCKVNAALQQKTCRDTPLVSETTSHCFLMKVQVTNDVLRRTGYNLCNGITYRPQSAVLLDVFQARVLHCSLGRSNTGAATPKDSFAKPQGKPDAQRQQTASASQCALYMTVLPDALPAVQQLAEQC